MTFAKHIQAFVIGVSAAVSLSAALPASAQSRVPEARKVAEPARKTVPNDRKIIIPTDRGRPGGVKGR